MTTICFLALLASTGVQLEGASYVPAKPAGLVSVLHEESGRIRLSSDGKHLVLVQADKLRVWNLATRKPVPTQRLDKELGLAEALFLPDGRLLVRVARLQNVEPETERGRMVLKTYDLDKQRADPIATAHGEDSFQGATALSPDGHWLATAGGPSDPSVIVWDVAKWKHLKVIRCDGWVKSLSFSPASKLLAIGTDEGQVQVLDTRHWKVRNEWKSPEHLQIARFVSEERLQVFWLHRKGISVNCRDALKIDASEPREAKSIQEKEQAGVAAIAPKANLVVLGHWKEKPSDNLRLHDLKTGKLLAACHAHEWGVREVVMTPDGKLIVTSGDDGVKLWSVPALLKAAKKK